MKQSDTPLKFVRANLAVILIVIGVIVSWTAMQSALRSQDLRITKLEAQYDLALRDLSGIRENMSGMKATLESIRLQVTNRP